MSDWEEAISEAKEELGYPENGYISSDQWNEVVETAKYNLQIERDDDYEDFCFCAKQNYKIYLLSDRWKKLRNKILFKYNYICIDCKEIANEVHHLTYRYLHTPEEESYCIPLCSKCHKKRHNIIKRG